MPVSPWLEGEGMQEDERSHNVRGRSELNYKSAQSYRAIACSPCSESATGPALEQMFSNHSSQQNMDH